jgi:hypothetical protein
VKRARSPGPSPAVSPNISGLLIAISGHRKSFHAERNAKMASAASTESGRMIREKTCQGPAPSMRAASSSSRGMVRKNWRRRKTPKAKSMAASGTIRPW